jgi:hypothetical protein
VARGQAPSPRLARRSPLRPPDAGHCAAVPGRAADSGRQAGQPAAQPIIRGRIIRGDHRAWDEHGNEGHAPGGDG